MSSDVARPHAAGAEYLQGGANVLGLSSFAGFCKPCGYKLEGDVRRGPCTPWRNAGRKVRRVILIFGQPAHCGRWADLAGPAIAPPRSGAVAWIHSTARSKSEVISRPR